MSEADAKRFGGGNSFGGRSSYSVPYKRSAIPPSPSRSASQQQAAAQNSAARQSMSNRGGLMGFLGGLALGGLLGSLFFGGAFENVNLLDILVFAGIAFLLYRLFASRAGLNQRPVYDKTAGYQDDQPHQSNPAGFDTDILFDKSKKLSTSENQPHFGQITNKSSDLVGFDQQAFLSGAKIAFTSLQKAWDDRDLAEIRNLSTDKVFAEIQAQLQATVTKNNTDILKLDAELLEIREIGSELEAVVLFDTIMREEINAQAKQVREVWHFVKPRMSIQPKWLLDGIQQLED